MQAVLDKLGIDINDNVFIVVKEVPMAPVGGGPGGPQGMAILPRLGGTFRGLVKDADGATWFVMRSRGDGATVAIKTEHVMEVGVESELKAVE